MEMSPTYKSTSILKECMSHNITQQDILAY